MQAKEAARRGDAVLGQRKAMYALLLNVIAVILYVYVAIGSPQFYILGLPYLVCRINDDVFRCAVNFILHRLSDFDYAM